MLLPKIKEREFRFKLALRIGLPIFALVVALVSHTLISSYNSLEASFYFESVLLLAFSIYFILFLIYNGFNIKIRDEISGAFSREYLYSYLAKEIKEAKEYTLVLISIDNLHDINHVHGIKNGDKILKEVVTWTAEYLLKADIKNFPIGHFKGGDFIIGLKGSKEKFTTVLELLCLKSSEFRVGEIEVKLSGTISDTNYTSELDFLVEHLFELQEFNKKIMPSPQDEIINPNDLELLVIKSIQNRDISLSYQIVFQNNKELFYDSFVKLRPNESKLLYPKSYVKVLNKLGLRVEFDLIVLESLIKKAVHTKVKTFAMNLSPMSLRNDKFIVSAKELLDEHRQSKEINIIFVLSEQEYYSYTSRFNSIIQSFKKKGVLICIDRVGTLHTSFLYLRELDIDMIRFDTYYSNEKKLKNNLAILDGFTQMAKEKGIKTWVKNIENDETLNLLKTKEIDYKQGNILSQTKII